MRRVKQITMLLISAALLAVVAAGCKSSDGDKSETLPEALPLLTEASNKLQDASAFELEIKVSGYPVEIAVNGLELPEAFALTFQYAQGTFVAPDRIQANVQFAVGDVATTANMIAIGPDQYLEGDLLTAGRWIQQDLVAGFTPDSLLAADTGIPHALETITALEMVGKKDMDGVKMYLLRGKVEASAVNSLTFGLIKTQTGQLDIEVYILTDDQMIDQIVLREPLPPGAAADAEPTTWTISITDYNTSTTVEAPAIDAG